MDLADLFRRERARRGLTLEDLASETKIPVGRLAAIEQEGLRPGAGFYERAQVRAYARALDVERPVLEQLKEEAQAAATVTPPQATEDHDRRVHVSSMAVATACVVALALGYAFFTRGEEPAVAVESPASSGAVPSSLGTIGTTEQFTPPLPAPLAEPVEAPPVAAAVTELVVTSNPEGARVTVDGIGWGVTPVTIRHLPQGLKRIRVTGDGYAAAERVVDVRPDRPARVSFDLRPVQPAPGS